MSVKEKLSLNIVVVVLFPKEPEYRPAFSSVYRSIAEFTGEDYLAFESKAQ